jgi:membrane-bound metal-dependent hydrolase YbcI (DUF457 family)
MGGLAAGWLIEAWGGRRMGPAVRIAILFALAGAAPDLDLLIAGAHRGPSHSIGFSLIVGLVAYAATQRGLLSIALACAFASHTLLDWMATDTSPPYGGMALWPLSREYYQSDLHLFTAISRRYWLPGFWWHNTIAVLRELLVLLPVLLLVGWWRFGRGIALSADRREV